MRELASRLGDMTDRITVFRDSISQDRLPSYLRPGCNFLGKYEVLEVMPFSKI